MFRSLAEIKGEASKHLRLSPAMHGDIVPAQVQLTRAKGTVRLDPVPQNSCNHRLQCRFQLREAVTQKETQVNALSIIVKFTLVNGQAGSFGKRFRKTIFRKKILKVILNTF